MKVIGVTGGVGSGKSVVLSILEKDYHAETILADLVAHDLMQPGGKSYEDIVEAFGDGILNDDGTIDRVKLGKLARNVFTSPYLVGTLARFNNAKRAEEHDRVKHSVSYCSMEEEHTA